MKSMAPEFYHEESAERQEAFGRKRTPVLIGLSGKKRHGKGTVAERLVERYGFTVVSFKSPIRDGARFLNPIIGHDVAEGVEVVRYNDIMDVYGYERAKDHYKYGKEIVRILQTWGEAVRALDEDFFVRRAENVARAYLESGRDVVVDDVRFPNEANWIHAMDGFLFRVHRPGMPTAVNGNHISETALDDYLNFTDVIINRGTLEDLNNKVDRMMELVRAAA